MEIEKTKNERLPLTRRNTGGIEDQGKYNYNDIDKNDK